MFKKKGLEPLIASILLIVVAVILVTIVLAWGKSFSTEGLNKANEVFDDTCSAATINVSGCDYNAETGGVTFFLKNTSSTYTFPASDFVISVVDVADMTHNAMDNAYDNLAIAPGGLVVGTLATSDVNTSTDTIKVNVSVRSLTCPTTATADMKNCS